MTASINPEVTMSLDDAVEEVMTLLTGLDLNYVPEYDRYYVLTRTLNRALRAVAREREWGYYFSLEEIALATAGTSVLYLTASQRPRIVGDDAVRLQDDDGETRLWAYFLPRDAGHKQQRRSGLWVVQVRNELHFSRPFRDVEEGLHVMVPIQREPVMFQLPEQPTDPNDPVVEVPSAVRDQPVDFPYPDLVVLKAAYMYAQTDPVMQPRVPTLEEQYADLKYQLFEIDIAHTDTPQMNEFFVPIQNGLVPDLSFIHHAHPHSDERRL